MFDLGEHLGLRRLARNPADSRLYVLTEAGAILRLDLDGRIGARLAAARSLLFERFDGDVRARMRLTEREMAVEFPQKVR